MNFLKKMQILTIQISILLVTIELIIQEEKLKRELWETMIATFMNNIQIQIDRVHIRYEDSISVPGTGSKLIKMTSYSILDQQTVGLALISELERKIIK